VLLFYLLFTQLPVEQVTGWAIPEVLAGQV